MKERRCVITTLTTNSQSKRKKSAAKVRGRNKRKHKEDNVSNIDKINKAIPVKY